MDNRHPHFPDQLELLSEKILRMGGMAEEAIGRSELDQRLGRVHE